MMHKMDHPNVMKLTDCHEDNQYIYLVMDLMADDLRNIINRNNPPMDENVAK